jgi:hypothetical protein
MTASERCAALRDALTEVALGVADGTTRGAVMAHLATCDSCREELSSLAAAADEVLLLAPEREPSADFEGRVLARLSPDQPNSEPVHPVTVRRHRARRAVLATAVGVGLLAVGGAGVWLATAPDRELATSYRSTLDTANGRYLAAADLTTDTGSGGSAQSVGTVFLYEGNPSWAYVVVRDAGAAPSYDVVVTVEAGADAGADAGSDPAHRYPHGADGPDPGGADITAGTREIALGPCVVEADTCSAGGVLDVAVHDVVSVHLTDPDGATWAVANRNTTD